MEINTDDLDDMPPLQDLVEANPPPTTGTIDDDDDPSGDDEHENDAPIRETKETTEAPEEFEIDDAADADRPGDNDSDETLADDDGAEIDDEIDDDDIDDDFEAEDPEDDQAED